MIKTSLPLNHCPTQSSAITSAPFRVQRRHHTVLQNPPPSPLCPPKSSTVTQNPHCHLTVIQILCRHVTSESCEITSTSSRIIHRHLTVLHNPPPSPLHPPESSVVTTSSSRSSAVTSASPRILRRISSQHPSESSVVTQSYRIIHYHLAVLQNPPLSPQRTPDSSAVTSTSS